MKPEAQPESAATIARELAEARAWFRAGEPEQAKTILARLLDEGAEYREVYLLLADVYRFEGETRQADTSLRMAAEAPRLPVTASAEPDKATARAQRQTWLAPPLPVYWPVMIGGGLLSLGAAVAVAWMPARYAWFGLNPLQILLVAVAGFLGLGSLAASGLIRTFDQELTEPGPGDDLPLWVYLLAAGLFSAWLAVGFLLWAAYTKGEYTRTFFLVLGAMAVLGAVVGVAMGGGGVFWWLALNVLWVSGLLGWALGSIASPREWWQS